MSYVCPVCGWPELMDPPHSESNGPSFEICPCCGFQFGYDDDDQGFTYAAWRERWIQNGMTWWSNGRPASPAWDARQQLARAGLLP